MFDLCKGTNGLNFVAFTFGFGSGVLNLIFCVMLAFAVLTPIPVMDTGTF